MFYMLHSFPRFRTLLLYKNLCELLGYFILIIEGTFRLDYTQSMSSSCQLVPVVT